MLYRVLPVQPVSAASGRDLEELVARRRAKRRLRSSTSRKRSCHCRRRAARLGKAIDLRPKEFLLLEYLVRNVNRPVTRTMILEHVWNSSFEGLTNVVDVYISALRSKVDRGFPQKLIQTNRGIGYTFTCVSALAPPASGYQARVDGGAAVS